MRKSVNTVTRYSINLPSELRKEMKKVAEKMGGTESVVVKLAIYAYLDRLKKEQR